MAAVRQLLWLASGSRASALFPPPSVPTLPHLAAMSDHDGLKACIAEVIGPLTNVVAGLSNDFKAQVDSNNRAIEKLAEITQSLQNDLTQMRKDREIFEAKIEEKFLAIQAQQKNTTEHRRAAADLDEERNRTSASRSSSQ